MPIRFAAARSTTRSPIARALAKRAVARAANDNGGGQSAFAFDAATRAALRHFAGHGLGAAEAARRNAEAAHASGDTATCAYWLGICRKLDRRVAARLERRIANDAALIF